ncbi:hypothetical protein AXF42_Ash013601 [Apostasia shenzhenica]|uniref:Uncharacterized protein n=1 Tax=Apostasia shenzhenica TaxID=1088818 RepID=A0A2I0APE4_9ASPA|nr:hypothetical protein AXF42_Ash013601 [Apostasia shenzhenica]
MSRGRVSFFGPFGLPGLHVVGDRIGIMSPRANPALPSRECCIGKFGLLSRSLSQCPRAVLATTQVPRAESEFSRITCRCPRGHRNVFWIFVELQASRGYQYLLVHLYYFLNS